MDEKIYAVASAADNPKVFRGYRGTSGSRMVVNSGRIIVHLIPCFGNSYVLSALLDYGNFSRSTEHGFHGFLVPLIYVLIYLFP